MNMTTPDAPPPPKPDQRTMLAAIGAVATSWALLEYRINQVIWAFSNVDDEDGACITAQIPSVGPRLRALVALAHRRRISEPLIKKLNSFTTDVDALGRQRNRVVHDPWVVSTKRGEF